MVETSVMSSSSADVKSIRRQARLREFYKASLKTLSRQGALPVFILIALVFVSYGIYRSSISRLFEEVVLPSQVSPRSLQVQTNLTDQIGAAQLERTQHRTRSYNQYTNLFQAQAEPIELLQEIPSE